jgi:hypothetical protein
MNSTLSAFGIRHWALTMLAVSFTVRLAHATVLLPADLSDLVAESTAIVHGRILDVRAEWAEGRRRIDSFVTLGAATYLKGSLGSSVTFKVPGGQLGAYRSVMVGAPSFAVGDEVILFLGNRGPSVPYVLGLSQGVFRVVTDPATGGRFVVPPPLLSQAAEPQRIVRGDGSRRPPSIERFAADVRALVARGAAQ